MRDWWAESALGFILALWIGLAVVGLIAVFSVPVVCK